MVWKFALWTMIVVSKSSVLIFGIYLDEWPYITQQDYSEQSPVDIITKNAQRRFLPFLRYNGYWVFDTSSVEITNNGHTVNIKMTNDSIDIPFISGGPLLDYIYEFEQMHLHWGRHDLGSEHKVNGHQYAMEVHIVHYKKEYGNFQNAQKYSDGLCVIGFFGAISPIDNPKMKHFISNLRHIIKPNDSIVRNFKDVFSWVKDTALLQHYYTYHGSLTTEPYTECVIWIIFTKPIEISSKQLSKFRELQSIHTGMLIHENDRELQPFNDRVIIHIF